MALHGMARRGRSEMDTTDTKWRLSGRCFEDTSNTINESSSQANNRFIRISIPTNQKDQVLIIPLFIQSCLFLLFYHERAHQAKRQDKQKRKKRKPGTKETSTLGVLFSLSFISFQSLCHPAFHDLTRGIRRGGEDAMRSQSI